MVDKRDRFEVIKNPLEAQLRQLEALGRQFQAVGINFYPADKVPDEADTIYFYVVTEELLGGKPGPIGKTLRQQLDESRGSAGWAVTPSTEKDGSVIDGLVDVVETVDPDKIARMPSARQAETERRQQLQQNIGRPVLRIVQDDTDPTD